MIDRTVEQLVDATLQGRTLNLEQARQLLALDEDSAEAAYIRWAAERIGRQASGNRGQVYAQIGIDARPCPGACAFCSFSAGNGEFSGDADVPLDEIVGYARTFDEAGVHLISLMSTAAYPFDRYLEVVSAVRSAVADDMPIMANTRDLNEEEAHALKDAGAQVLYHAKRLGEGSDTNIAPERRIRTIAAARNAGLTIMSAVGPVSARSSIRAIAAGIFEVIGFHPYCSGVGILSNVEGTAFAHVPSVSRARGAFLAAVMRLCAGTSIPFGTGCGNVVWTDAGTNPRGRQTPTDPEILMRDVARLRRELKGRGWDVPARAFLLQEPPRV